MKIITFFASLIVASSVFGAGWLYTPGTSPWGTITDSDNGWVLNVYTTDGVNFTLRSSSSAYCVAVNGTGVCDLTTGVTNQNGAAMQVVGTYHTGVANTPGAFKTNTVLTKIIFPEGFVTLHTDSFNGCANLQEAILPNSLEAIGGSAFSGCSKLHNVVVSENLKTYNGNSFINCTSLTNDAASLFPGSVTTIGASAFESTAISGALVITNKSMTIINNKAFQKTKLTSVDLSQSAIVTFGTDVFNTTTTLGEVFLPETIKDIGTAVFNSCSSLTNVTPLLPDSVVTIAGNVFYNAPVTGKLVLSNPNLKSLGANSFRNTKLTYVDMSQSGIQTLNSDVFNAVPTLGEVRLPETLQTIGQSAFNSCSSLTNVTPLLPGSVISLSGSIFLNSPITGDLVLTNANLTSIGASAFSGTTANVGVRLKSVNMSGSGITVINDSVFKGISSTVYNQLGSVVFSDCIERIGMDAFKFCANITNMVPFLPLSVTNISSTAFDGCAGLPSPLILGGEKHVGIGNQAFQNTKISEVYFGAGITTLAGTQIFSGVTTLTNIWFKGNRPTFSANLFPGYANDLMARFFIPKGDASWDALTNLYEFALLNNTEEENYIAKYGNKNIPLGKFKPPVVSNGKFQYLCTWRLPIADDLITVILVK